MDFLGFLRRAISTGGEYCCYSYEVFADIDFIIKKIVT